jgi:hypothetical protein
VIKRPKARPKADWPHLRPSAALSVEEAALVAEYAGLGFPQKLQAYAMWLDEGEHISQWVEAMYSFDEGRGLSELLGLLRSKSTLPPEDRRHLADLIKRYKFETLSDKDYIRAIDEIETRGKSDRELALCYLVSARRDASGAAAQAILLLEDDKPLTRSDLARLADLFEFHQARRSRGNQSTPSYQLTIIDALLNEAVKCVRMHRKKGKKKKSLDQAIAIARELYDIPPPDTEKDTDVLLGAYNGRYGGLGRALRRLRPRKS